MTSSSDKLLRQKQEKEQTSRIDQLSRSVELLKRELSNFRRVIEKQNQETKKQLRELFAFTNKLENAYLNGLSNSTLDYDIQEDDNADGTNLFDINLPFRYDA